MRYSQLSNGLYNRFDNNRLYRVNGVLKLPYGMSCMLSTGISSVCQHSACLRPCQKYRGCPHHAGVRAPWVASLSARLWWRVVNGAAVRSRWVPWDLSRRACHDRVYVLASLHSLDRFSLSVLSALCMPARRLRSWKLELKNCRCCNDHRVLEGIPISSLKRYGAGCCFSGVFCDSDNAPTSRWPVWRTCQSCFMSPYGLYCTWLACCVYVSVTVTSQAVGWPLAGDGPISCPSTVFAHRPGP